MADDQDTIDKVKNMAMNKFQQGPVYQSYVGQGMEELAEVYKKRYADTIADQYRNGTPRMQEDILERLAQDAKPGYD